MKTAKISHISPRVLHVVSLALVLTLGLILRLWGITWSLPADGGFSFHPDEIFQVAASMRIDLLNLQLNPEFYNYGTMYFYMISAMTTIGAVLGIVNLDSLADVYMVARLVTALLGAAIPYLVYLTAIRLYSRSVALVAAAFAAVTPIAVVHSHFATVDIPSTFWVAACLAASAAVFHRSSIWAFVLAGLFAGFAGATKYGAAAVIIAPFVAHLTTMPDAASKTRLTVKPLVAILVAMAAGFVIGNPGSVLWTGEFLDGFTYEMRHAQAGHGLVFEGTGTGWTFHLTSSLRYGFGLSFLLLSVGGLILMALDRNRRGWFLIIFALIFYLIIGAAEVRFARYIIPLVPALSIAAAVTVVSGCQSSLKLRRAPLRKISVIVWCFVAAIFFYNTIAHTMALNSLFTKPDTRVRTVEWFEANAPRGSTIVLPGTPWFYSPAFRPEFTRMWPSERLAAMSQVTDYRLITNGQRPWDWNLLKGCEADYVIVSDFESLDAIRARDADAAEFFAVLRACYELEAIIAGSSQNHLSFRNTADLPHDLKYASPTLTIFRRRM